MMVNGYSFGFDGFPDTAFGWKLMEDSNEVVCYSLGAGFSDNMFRDFIQKRSFEAKLNPLRKMARVLLFLIKLVLIVLGRLTFWNG